MLDEGRVVDTGTHEELTARCPLYRLLLSGPGEDAEGVDAGELERDAHVGESVDGITPQLWDPARAPAAGPAATGVREEAAGRPGGHQAMLGALPATPELLAQVAALPPARDTPDVPVGRARAADPGFGLRTLIRPFRAALALSLLLVGLDTAAGLALPALIRRGIDQGVLSRTFDVIEVVSLIGLAVVLADWAVVVAQTRVTGRIGERLLYTLRLKTFAHLQRLGLDYYEREFSGRIMTRMTTDVDALSTFLQTGLVYHGHQRPDPAGVLIALLVIDVRLGLVVLSVVPVLLVATLVFRAKSSKAYTDAREKVSAVNADLQENVAGLRVTQAYRREGRNADRFAERSDDYRLSRLRAQRYIAVYFPFVELLFDIVGGAGAAAGAARVHSGALTAGALIAYPALPGPLLLADQAAVAGLRRLPAGHRRPAAARATCCGRRPRHRRAPIRGRPAGCGARWSSTTYGSATARGAEALSGVSVRIPAGPDRRPGGRDRCGQVHRRQADRPVLRRDVGRGADRRHRRAGLRPGRLPAPARRGAPGGVPVPRYGPRRHRLRAARRERRGGRGRRPRGRRPRR